MTPAFHRLEATVLQALRGLLGLGVIALVLLNVANAAGRYGGLPTLTGADELLVYGMIWIVMIGAILTTRDRAHLAIDLLPQSLGPAGKQALATFTSFVTAASCGFVAWHSWSFIERIGAIGQKSMGLGIPMVVPHLAVFTGFAGMAVIALILGLRDLAETAQGRAE